MLASVFIVGTLKGLGLTPFVCLISSCSAKPKYITLCTLPFVGQWPFYLRRDSKLKYSIFSTDYTLNTCFLVPAIDQISVLCTCKLELIVT